jgi:prolyl 4-hydroxylase
MVQDYDLGEYDFIRAYKIDEGICDRLIEVYDNSDKVHQGTLGDSKIDHSLKKSMDLALYPGDENLNDYLNSLSECLEKYKKEYSYIDKNMDTWGITTGMNIQKYNPDDGYYVWHAERSSACVSNRLLTYMTYLNDVDDEEYNGGTEWLYQKLKIKPEKGLTILWPVDWMFTHRGIVSNKSVKYIITGWYSFI